MDTFPQEVVFGASYSFREERESKTRKLFHSRSSSRQSEKEPLKVFQFSLAKWKTKNPIFHCLSQLSEANGFAELSIQSQTHYHHS